ncbi:PCMD domain-containing protein [Flammeovirga pacifica]|uniref:Putative carbohydrate metabolism domain-containing protein n=1 Tax=Flammeovirga pacifica TaxID=915059 RepID=A0A1S1Z1L6_FLAPC|nr:PCMD domain-containing protein [Flammeovirga pacifica]OHX67160.1 hypothetical protein NH26_12835 [Flammeovirga pacifica]
MKKLYKLIVISILIAFSSCIKNDIPYPTVFGEFLHFTIEDQVGATRISTAEQTVTIRVPSNADLTNLTVDSVVITADAMVSPDPLEVIDFSEKVIFTIKTYQEYDWEVIVEKEDEEEISLSDFTIEGQVRAEINQENQTIDVIMPSGVSLEDLTISVFDYNPISAVVSPLPSETHDFTNPVVFTFNDTLSWTVNVSNLEDDEISLFDFKIEGQLSVDINQENQTIDVLIPAGVSLENLTISVFNYEPISTVVSPLPSETHDFTNPVVFTFNDTLSWTVNVDQEVIEGDQVPYSNFQTWFQTGSGDRSFYLPGQSLDENIWRSGDKAAADLWIKTYPKTVTPYPSIDTPEYALLETKSTAGVIAAGSLFTGDIKGSGISNVTTDFGIPFTDRPKSFTTEIEYNPEVYGDNIVDKCDVYVILQVREGSGSDEKRYRLATGWFRTDENMDSFKLLDIPMVYGDDASLESYMLPNASSKEMPEEGFYDNLEAQPTHIIMVFASSADGANFNGGVGSKLKVKNIELKY